MQAGVGLLFNLVEKKKTQTDPGRTCRMITVLTDIVSCNKKVGPGKGRIHVVHYVSSHTGTSSRDLTAFSS